MAWTSYIKHRKSRVFGRWVSWLLVANKKESMANYSHLHKLHWIPVPTTQELNQKNGDHVVLAFTDPQPGGVKVGQAAKILTNICPQGSLVDAIDNLTSSQPSMGILFDNFDGDVVGNWGREGAADAWKAYLHGFGNLYCDAPGGGKEWKRRLNAGRIVFAGMLEADDLQQKALALAAEKRQVDANNKLSALVKEHSLRLTNLLKEMTRSSLLSLFVLSGGDNAIYACARAIKVKDNEILLLRLDRHMDERDLSLRSDPHTKSKELHPHSGNGLTQAKAERLIKYDFLIGCDYERNNDECLRNSRACSETCVTSITTIDEMRFDPKTFIDEVITEINEIMTENNHVDLIVNLDCDTLNGIPSSAETFTGGLDPTWGFYLLHMLSQLPRPPKIVRIAELHYCGDEQRQRVAVDFAAEILKSGVKAVERFAPFQVRVADPTIP